ncbi:hypothetical protein FKM82_013104 [Ascaphus truei]
MNSGKAMTLVLTVISLLLVTEFCLSLGDDCPENSVYNDCASPCYQPPTCGKPVVRFPAKSKCMTVCVKGCFCKAGYLRNRTGACVLPKNC